MAMIRFSMNMIAFFNSLTRLTREDLERSRRAGREKLIILREATDLMVSIGTKGTIHMSEGPPACDQNDPMIFTSGGYWQKMAGLWKCISSTTVASVMYLIVFSSPLLAVKTPVAYAARVLTSIFSAPVRVFILNPSKNAGVLYQ